jgi:hypothetical protein
MINSTKGIAAKIMTKPKIEWLSCRQYSSAEDNVIFVKDSSDQNQYAGSFFVKPDIEVAADRPLGSSPKIA